MRQHHEIFHRLLHGTIATDESTFWVESLKVCSVTYLSRDIIILCALFPADADPFYTKQAVDTGIFTQARAPPNTPTPNTPTLLEKVLPDLAVCD